MIQSVLRASLASAATLMLTACSAATNVEEQQPSQAEFSAEDKRVERFLRVSSFEPVAVEASFVTILHGDPSAT